MIIRKADLKRAPDREARARGYEVITAYESPSTDQPSEAWQAEAQEWINDLHSLGMVQDVTKRKPIRWAERPFEIKATVKRRG